MQVRPLLLALIFISGSVCLISCGKAADTTPKITGSWDEASIHEIDQTDHVTTSDNLQHVPPGFNLLQINTDGTYTLYPQGASSTSGTYTYSGGRLALISASHPAGDWYDVDSLEPYKMSIRKVDTVSSGSPLMTRDITLSYTK
ncbi:MAG: hypothetical protein JWO03_2286 [Bacteroidetes bacterium]|nr:hypothetical protein [Bacteroidota bacterium]